MLATPSAVEEVLTQQRVGKLTQIANSFPECVAFNVNKQVRNMAVSECRKDN